MTTLIALLIGVFIGVGLAYFAVRIALQRRATHAIHYDDANDIASGMRGDKSSKQNEIAARAQEAKNAEQFTSRVREKILRDEYKSIAETKASIEDQLLALPCVVGVAIGAVEQTDQAVDKPFIDVFLESDDDDCRKQADQIINDALGSPALASDTRTIVRNGIPFRFTETGKITVPRNLLPGFDRFNPLRIGSIVLFILPPKVRPVKGGVSIGRGDTFGQGTLGICCHEQGAPSALKYMLSNNHVLANTNKGVLGDVILQPDGSGGTHVIGNLAGYVPIEFLDQFTTPINYIDAAIATAIYTDDLDTGILDIGDILGCEYAPKIQTGVQKMGSETKHSQRDITHVDATIKIGDYGWNNGVEQEAVFRHQIVVDLNAAGGDSGSLVVSDDETPRAIGLLFAKTPSGTLGVVNSILLVEWFLGIRMPGSTLAPDWFTP